MKKAFTMIELIFVIVIIGILAAVAIPKLAATRDDAKVATTANAVANTANEIAARAMASGIPSDDIPAMSRIASGMIAQNKAVFDSSAKQLKIKMKSIDDCLILAIVTSTNDANLTLTYGNAGTDQVCKALQGAIDADDYPMPLRGKMIEY
jgi:general secretion pathway protein G